MRTMPVVSVHPRFEVGKTMRGILVDARVGPFADDGLDEAFGFAVGAGRVEAGAFVFDPQVLAASSEEMGAETRAVVGEHAADGDAEASEVIDGLLQESNGGDGLFVGQQGGESDAGVIVDGDEKKLPAHAASFILGIAGDAMARFRNAGELFDVQVQQIAGSGMLVAHLPLFRRDGCACAMDRDRA